MITKLKFPFTFDSDALKKDLQKFSNEDWTPHFNTSYYEGDWSGVALRAPKNALVQLYPVIRPLLRMNTKIRRCWNAVLIFRKF
jgi:hypothetical protein